MNIVKRALLALPALLVASYVVGVTSCTSLPHHTAEPFASDALQAAAIEAAAAKWCEELGEPEGAPPQPFRFDGCSWWPDGDYRHCCECHDYAYWCGGSAALRKRADRELRQCVAKQKGAAFGRLMEIGVRVGGHPVVPMYFRWGYGHAYDGIYPPQSPSDATLPPSPRCEPLSKEEAPGS
jgi:hypothetical protein